MAGLSQPAIRQNPAGFCLILTEEIRGICIFLNIHGRQKDCKRIGAGAGGGAAGALDINSHDAAPRKNFETRVFFEAENGRIIARFWGTFCEFSGIFSRLCIHFPERHFPRKGGNVKNIEEMCGHGLKTSSPQQTQNRQPPASRLSDPKNGFADGKRC